MRRALLMSRVFRMSEAEIDAGRLPVITDDELDQALEEADRRLADEKRRAIAEAKWKAEADAARAARMAELEEALQVTLTDAELALLTDPEQVVVHLLASDAVVMGIGATAASARARAVCLLQRLFDDEETPAEEDVDSYQPTSLTTNSLGLRLLIDQSNDRSVTDWLRAAINELPPTGV
jgi:hypothetical protein